MARLPLVLALACVCSGLPARAVTLAVDGKATATIFHPEKATPAELTAAREVADYLGRVTGGKFAVAGDAAPPPKGARIYVGPPESLAKHSIDVPGLGPEEWLVRTVGDNTLVLVGGRPRGALYAAYRFLEDVVGVHWWNPWEESVPKRPTLKVGNLDRRGRPALRYRDIYMLYGNDGGRFAARNRLNRQGDAGIAKEYGGEMNYGPPYHVHTLYMYCPPDPYFKEHPDWFSLIGGKRSADYAQLCLTNQALRDFFVAKLREYIRTSREGAEKAGVPPPVVYDISQNDWGGACQCENCQAIAKAEGSEAGPLLDFVNHIADAIKGEYPGIAIDTLAYAYTQKAPKTIKPRGNVIIRLCDTTSNFTKSIVDPANRPFREHLRSWAAIAKNLRIWDYAVSYAQYYGLPMPTVQTYPIDYRFYTKHNVEGVFTEHEYVILADWRDLKVWMMMKLLEDPYRDYEVLVKQFTDGFCGPAGRDLREYLARLQAASDEKPSYLSMGASPPQYKYLDLAFVRGAQAVLDRAERAVGGDAVLLRRVRHARMPIDRATVVLYPKLVGEWMAQGGDAAKMPLDRDAIAKRYHDTWYAQIDLRLPEDQRAAERQQADAEVARLTARPAYVPLPEKFRGLPPGSVFDYIADASRNWQDTVKVVPDAEAETGITDRLELSDEDMQKYKLPMPWGLYDQISKQGFSGQSIQEADVPGPGYHWYQMGTYTIGPSYYQYFFWSWIIQFDVDNVYDAKNPEEGWEVWARIKFAGPGFPHGRPEDRNAICVERLVLVKAQ